MWRAARDSALKRCVRSAVRKFCVLAKENVRTTSVPTPAYPTYPRTAYRRELPSCPSSPQKLSPRDQRSAPRKMARRSRIPSPRVPTYPRTGVPTRTPVASAITAEAQPARPVIRTEEDGKAKPHSESPRTRRTPVPAYRRELQSRPSSPQKLSPRDQ